jgi:hypothetical protein
MQPKPTLLKTVLIFFCALASLRGGAQPPTDTLRLAQALVARGELQGAESLLAHYHRTNRQPYTYQLHAQLLYWLQQPQKSLTLYEEGLRIFPSAHFLRFDYGRVLFETGRHQQAEAALASYLLADSLHAEASILLAYLQLWKGEVEAARQGIARLQQRYGQNDAVNALATYARNYYADRLEGGVSFLSDDQPLQGLQGELSYTALRSSFLSPTLSLRANRFSPTPGRTAWLRGANSFSFAQGKTRLTTELGYFTAEGAGGSLTGSLTLVQQLTPALRLRLATEKLPYQFTLSSIQRPFLYRLHSGSLWFENKKALVSGGANLQAFPDGNRVVTGHAWGLYSLLRPGPFQLMLGYGFSIANAERSSFAPVKSLPELVQSQGANTPVQGQYEGYFTPLNQQVHSLLASLQLKTGSLLTLRANLSYGISAAADNPVLFLERRNGNNYVVQPYRYRQGYTPVEGGLTADLTPGGRVAVQAAYRYARLFFYTRQEGSLRLTYRLSE